MIRIYGPNEKNFTDNGTVISPLLCEIEEVANGIYELYLEAQLEDVDVLEEWNLIKVPTPKNDQIFRIYRPIKTLDRIEVYARHIFYDLAGNFLEDVRPTNLTTSATLDYVLQNTRFAHNFTGYSNLQTYNTAYYIRKNPVEAIIGTGNSILNRWGGFLERDNYQINILQAGIDRGYEVIYGKNLLGVECDVNTNDIITSLMPTWVKGESTRVNNTPSKYVNSPLINNYPVPRVQEFRVELTEAEQELTDSEIVTLVTERATAQFAENHIDEPKVTVDIDFVELSMTEEYKDLEFLQQIYIHDYVTVKVPHLNISVIAQVTNYTYDCLNKRYTKLRIGNVKSNLSSNNFTVHELNNKIDTATDYLTEELEKAKDLITQVEDGYVTFRKTSENKIYEILISDTEDITKAVNVIRLNKAGIGFSSNGYNGPFSTAITIAGGIVADFITSGTLKANLIKAGILQDKYGDVIFDLDKGTFKLGNVLNFDGTSLTTSGTFKSLFGTGNTAIEQSENRINFYRRSPHALQGWIDAGYWGSTQEKGLVGLTHNAISSMALLYYTDSSSSPYMIFDKNLTSGQTTSTYPIRMDQGARYYGKSQFNNDVEINNKTTIDSNTYLNYMTYMKGINNTSGGIYNANDDFTNWGKTICNGAFEKISGGSYKLEMNPNLTVYNNSPVKFYSTLDMNNYSILNNSDVRMKKNIEDTSVNGLEFINSIDLKQFDWIQSGEHEDIGIIAQQLQELNPKLVGEDEEIGKLSIDKSELIYYLVKAVQELSGKNKARKTAYRDPYTLEEKIEFCKTVPAGEPPKVERE